MHSVVFYELNNAFSGLEPKRRIKRKIDDVHYIMYTNNAHLYIYMYTFVHIRYIYAFVYVAFVGRVVFRIDKNKLL